MKRRFNETIDGSIKNIIQLKTVNNFLEWSQMYDALEDCPVEFINKLIQTLNSLGETMGVEPTQTFDKVLCNVNDNNEETRKKLYNWWRGVFEVLGSCKNSIPKDREDEFNEKVDALMAEILKSGDGQNTAEEEPEEEEGGEEEVMLEEYEPADKEDETNMLADMKWAVGKIGEIANRVQELINFVNPYCEVNESMMDNKPARYSIGDKVLYKGEECVVIDVDEDLQNDEEIYQVSRDSDKVDGLSFNDWVTWDEIELINGFEKEDKSKMKREKTIWKEIRQTSQDDWVDAGEVFEMANESDEVEEFWKAMDDVDDLERKGYWSGKFKVGDKVMWNDPEYDEWTDGWTVTYAPEDADKDAIYTIENDDGSEVEVLGSELRPAKMAKESDLENELGRGDDGWVEIGQPVGESKPVELESGATKKVSLYVDWDDDGAGLDSNVVIDVPAEIADSEESTALYDYITDWIDQQEFCVNDWAITDIEGLDNAVELEGTDWKEISDEAVLENNDEEVTSGEVTSGEVKDGEKQVTQDGETKTLVTGEENKKPVCEMTIEQEVDDPWKLSELLWSQGKENLEELLRSELVGEEEIMQMLEDTGVRNLTNINDLFAFDFPSVLDSLGLDGEAWSQNLEFKRKSDDDTGDDGSEGDDDNEMVDWLKTKLEKLPDEVFDKKKK